MIDIRLLETDFDTVKAALSKRGGNIDLNGLLDLSRQKRELMASTEKLKAERNSASKEIGIKMKNGEDAAGLKERMKSVSDEIKDNDARLAELHEKEKDLLLDIPNLLDDSVPAGKDESENVIERTWGEKPSFAFTPRPHWDILDQTGGVDFERGAKIAGAKFPLYRSSIARLERALINFMLTLHTGQHGYEELTVPLLVNNDSMTGTGQFPKFKDEYYTLERDSLSLIPTAEVPLTNFFRDEIITEEDLPVRFTSATSCFRREAGAAGRDTRGLVRVHQFQKVELVTFCHPDQSKAEHDRMLAAAEKVLQLLGLHYRVVLLCGGDTSASSSKTWDLEVWMPGQDRFVEISSVSNFMDFQARRSRIRFKGKNQKKPALVHTLNGSGLAAGRTVAAVIENYQTEEGFDIPDALKPFLELKV